MRFDLIIRQAALAAVVVAGLFTGACAKSPADTGPVDRATEPAPAAQPTTPPKNSAAAADSRPVIVTFGDSLTAGHGADPGQSYPDYLQRDLNQQGYDYRVVNEGISGDTTSGGLSRVDRVVALQPSLVVLELGGNDGLRGVPVPNIKDNLARIIEELKRAHSHIVLAEMTLPPNYGQDYIKPFEALYRELAAKYHLPAFTFPFRELFEKNLLQADGMHVTPQGNELVAQTVLKTIEPMLQKPK